MSCSSVMSCWAVVFRAELACAYSCTHALLPWACVPTSLIAAMMSGILALAPVVKLVGSTLAFACVHQLSSEAFAAG